MEKLFPAEKRPEGTMHVWFLPLMLRLLLWTALQISLLSWKYGFLIQRSTWGGTNSTRAGPRADGWNENRPGYQHRRPLQGTQLPSWPDITCLHGAPPRLRCCWTEPASPASPTYTDRVLSRYKLRGGHVPPRARRPVFVCEPAKVLRAR